MRENNDRTLAKSRILVGKVTGDMVILVETGSVQSQMVKASIYWP